MIDILFILKKNQCYNFVSYTRRSSGLWNSTRFIVESLKKNCISSEIIEVVDNNCIDRFVTKYRPKIVVIEALWVVPEKFDILKKLHPNVKWFIHLHSHMPFLALEGNAIGWIKECADRGIGIIANHKESYQALRAILTKKQLTLLPNVYLSHFKNPLIGLMKRIFCPKKLRVLDVGCFGAIRPLKNQFLQALAAIEFAKKKRRYLRFHINGSRVETGGNPVLKNLQQLFKNAPNAELIEHPWMEPEDFIKLLHDKIDIGMQVSLTETFCVVAADYVTACIPVVLSKEIKWASMFSKAKDDSIKDIVRLMDRALKHRSIIVLNKIFLYFNSIKAQYLWRKFVIDNRRKQKNHS